MSIYEDKVKKAVAIIKENLSEDLIWKDISKECGISEFHFHRIFTGVMNEAPREFIIRSRLEKSISLLVYCNKLPLADIALECGYSSQSNFSKAFKDYFGVTPKQVQKDTHPENSKIGKIKSKYGKEFSVEDLYPKSRINDDPVNREVIMNVKIEEFPVREVVFESSKGGYKIEAIHQVWEEVMSTIAAHGNKMEAITTLGIGHSNPQVTPIEKCRYDACVATSDLSNVPAKLKTMEIPGGKFACFYYKGKSEKLLDLYLSIYSNWFSENGYEPGDFPHVERYIHVDKENPEADIELEAQFLLK